MRKTPEQLLQEARAAEMNGDLAKAKRLREKAYNAGRRAAPVVEDDQGNQEGGVRSAQAVTRPSFSASSEPSQEGTEDQTAAVEPEQD